MPGSYKAWLYKLHLDTCSHEVQPVGHWPPRQLPWWNYQWFHSCVNSHSSWLYPWSQISNSFIPPLKNRIACICPWYSFIIFIIANIPPGVSRHTYPLVIKFGNGKIHHLEITCPLTSPFITPAIHLWLPDGILGKTHIINVENPPFTISRYMIFLYFPEETMGFPHLC
jgi:hypothetical protein